MCNTKLFFQHGCMASGKSLQLLAMAHSLTERGIRILILKPSIDNRDGENVIHSRALGDRECVSVSPELDIYAFVGQLCGEITERGINAPKWILVDEAQFLTEKQVDQLASIVDDYRINIMCFGLRTDFQTHLFPGSKRLFEVADSISEIKSSCACGRKTIFNARIDQEGNIIRDGNQIEIGGDDKYIALCRHCYYQNNVGHCNSINNEQ